MATPVPTVHRWTAAGLALLAAGVLAACGSDDDGATSPVGGASVPTTQAGGGAGYGGGGGVTETQTQPTGTPRTTEAGGVAGAAATRLSIEAVESDGRLAWSRRSLSARPGVVTIAARNPSRNELPHAVEVEGAGVEKESPVVQPGGAAVVSTKLRPGRYVYYCPVGNHRELGMEGTLTVR